MTEAAEKIITGEKRNMALKSVESQNVELKSNWPMARLEREGYNAL